ncbi:hypothetical protein ACTT2I_02240 [Stenotrophomonas sp. PUT21]|uniref:hypothetical protein n=1 Tax=Stenotrophomonas TaxID=40323 RepID=UPI003B7FED3E
MSAERMTCDLTLFLKGDALDPRLLTDLLGVQPTKAHAKGRVWTTSAGTEVTDRNGLWMLSLTGGLSDVSSLILRLHAIIEKSCRPVLQLPGVSEAFIDFLVMVPALPSGGADCHLAINHSSVVALGELGLPVEISFSALATSVTQRNKT